MRSIVRTAIAVTCLAMVAPVLAQTKMGVYVAHTTPDTVGGRLAYAVKEAIRRSAGFRLADSENDGRIAIRMVSFKPENSGDTYTIYSAVFTVETFHQIPVTMFLTNFVGSCGSSRLNECADNLVAMADEEAAKVRRWTAKK